MSDNTHEPNEQEFEQASSFSFPKNELTTLAFWKERNIFQRSLEQTKNAPPYIFYDGPPFATGLPHHGHLVGSTLKDTVPRYFTMKGFYVDRRFGWDCHGLPIEYEIDKNLGMSAHEAVQQLGVAHYNNQCRAIVQKYVSQWRTTIERLGRWVDFDRDYKTMDCSFMESVWWVFAQLWKKNLVYQSVKVMPFSTALHTPLSNFEASSNYQEVQDPSIVVSFPWAEDPETAFLAWTTTPWTLPSNLGLCLHPEVTYVAIQLDLPQASLQRVVLAKALYEQQWIKQLPGKILWEKTGAQLSGIKYLPLFNYYQSLSAQGAFQTHTDTYVTTVDGTGIVHLAPAFGEDDFRVLKNINPQLFVMPVNDRGEFTQEIAPLKGIYFKEADKKIIQQLKEIKRLIHQDTLVHPYPFCPRSRTPLMYKAVPSWFVAVEKIKADILAANQEIHWVPEHIQQGRFGQWLQGARDWAISRNRVWGTPLPLWINDQTGDIRCISSRAELEQLTGASLTDLHREHVDHLTFMLPNSKGTYRRISEVFDCWFESGSMPYAQLHYPFENQKLFEAGFPAAFIAEGLDQTRGWFYTLTVLAAALYQRPAFNNVIVNGLVLAKDGKKMSKSLRNYTPADELMEEHGADALRLYLISSALVKGEDLRFQDEGPKEMTRKVLIPWLNSCRFLLTYARADQWQPSHLDAPSQQDLQGATTLDRWILSRLHTLMQSIETEMNQYHLYNVVDNLLLFMDQLTNGYIRLSRRRFWQNDDSISKQAAFNTLFHVIFELNKLMAPFAPFLAEYLYGELQTILPDHLLASQPESVHLCSYPVSQIQGGSYTNPALEEVMNSFFSAIDLGRLLRSKNKIKVKIPLSQLTVVLNRPEQIALFDPLVDMLKAELNIKQLQVTADSKQYYQWTVKPNFPVLGKKAGKQMKACVQWLASWSEAQVLALKKQKQLPLSTFQVAEHLTELKDIGLEDVILTPKIHSHLKSDHFLVDDHVAIDLDPTLRPELLEEGMVREFTSFLQKKRKELQFEVSDRIHVVIAAKDATTREILERGQPYWSAETLCERVTWNKTSPLADVTPFEIDHLKGEVIIERLTKQDKV